MAVLLIFDLDGTLIDSKSCIVKATQQAFETSGLAIPTEEDIVSSMGIPIEVTFPRWSCSIEVEDLLASYRNIYKEVSKSELKVFDGIPEALTWLHGRHTLTIATSKKHSVAEQNLETTGLLQYFDMLIGSDDVENYKPHPESIERILERFHTPRIQTWMIGDATTDLEMGEAARVCTCAVTWGAHSTEVLANCVPTSILHSPDEFLWLFNESN